MLLRPRLHDDSITDCGGEPLAADLSTTAQDLIGPIRQILFRVAPLGIEVHLKQDLNVRRNQPLAYFMSNPPTSDGLHSLVPTMVTDKSTFDPTYADRYKDRNARKLAKILECLKGTSATLDIGCNNGYLDNGILSQNPSCTCHAVELDRSAIQFNLLSNPQFELFETNVTDFRFQRSYDAIVYNAVHHHVIGKFGQQVAMRVWDDIVDHCNQTLIFETGILSEKGKYYWKTAIAKLFESDEKHIQELFRRIGARLQSVEVVDRVPIHGTERDLFRISLHPIDSEQNLKQHSAAVFGNAAEDDDQLSVIQSFRRTHGRHGQQLVSIDEPASNGDHMFAETNFHLLERSGSREKIFAKQIIRDFYKTAREFSVHRQVEHPRVVQLIGYSESYGLLFPYVDWNPFGSIDWQAIENAEAISNEVGAFYEYANSKMIKTGQLDVEPYSTTERRLIDIIDIHSFNFLAEVKENRVTDWCVIDMEYFSNDNAARNQHHRRHLMRIMSGASSGIRGVLSSITRMFE